MTRVPDTSDTSVTPAARMQGECDTSGTRVQQKCDTIATLTARVQHECYTNDTSATQVKNFDFDNDMSKNIFSHRYIYYLASERL